MDKPPEAPMMRMARSLLSFVEAPVIWFREKIVEPNQQKYPWYHQKFRRVPTIDECYTDDLVCYFEADYQYNRDRYEDCCLYNDEDRHVCDHLYETYEVAAGNYMAQHGDLGGTPTVRDAFMKQKHRMIWERRHGPVGSGMKQ